jgi:hypothetical protein
MLVRPFCTSTTYVKKRAAEIAARRKPEFPKRVLNSALISNASRSYFLASLIEGGTSGASLNRRIINAAVDTPMIIRVTANPDFFSWLKISRNASPSEEPRRLKRTAKDVAKNLSLKGNHRAGTFVPQQRINGYPASTISCPMLTVGLVTTNRARAEPAIDKTTPIMIAAFILNFSITRTAGMNMRK